MIIRGYTSPQSAYSLMADFMYVVKEVGLSLPKWIPAKVASVFGTDKHTVCLLVNIKGELHPQFSCNKEK